MNTFPSLKLSAALCLALSLAGCGPASTDGSLTPTAGVAEIAATQTMLAQTNGTPISTEGLTTEMATPGTPQPVGTQDMTGSYSTAQPVNSLTAVQIRQDETLGAYLTDSLGRPLYIYNGDTSTVSTCTSACAQEWLPVIVNSTPTVMTGVESSLLGTTLRTDGTLQLTYNGHPVYFNANDTTNGEMTGQGADNAWYLITPDGTAAH